MGQKLRDDKITILSHSAGNIILASGAYLTIGGQQYVTSSQLIVALPVMTASTRYFIYAVLSGGVPALVISQNVNSVGPVGFTSWKLVGALFADGSVTPVFGAFINIKGIPACGPFFSGFVNIATDGGTFNKANVVIDRTVVSIRGKMADFTLQFSMGAGTSSGAEHIVRSPANLAIDFNSIVTNSIAQVNADGGSGYIASSGLGKTADFCHHQTFNGWVIAFDQPSGSNATSTTTNQPNTTSWFISGRIKFPVVGLSDTPLEDL